MNLTRRSFVGSVAATALLSAGGPLQAKQPITVTDMAGRQVQLPDRPKRIVLLEAHDLLTMSLLHPDPASLVAGWAGADRIDSPPLQTRLLNGHDIATIGLQGPETVSVEGLLDLWPDLVVTSSLMMPQDSANPLLQKLEQLGIPVVISDAASNANTSAKSDDPRAELKASMQMWGTLLGAETRAQAYIEFAESQLAIIAGQLVATSPVTTYLEVQSTPEDCCWAAGRKIWGQLLEMAGGRCLPAVNAPWYQKLSLEYVLTEPHEVYIASGGGWAAAGRPAIGPGLNAEKGRQDLQRLIDGRAGFDTLASVRNGRVHGIWTGLIANMPLNVLFVAIAAKWLHPDACAELDPASILETINRDFAAFPIDGPLWISI